MRLRCPVRIEVRRARAEDETGMSPLRKVLCSLAVGSHRRFLDLSGPAFEDYASRHGYDLVLETRSLCHERPVSWSKVLLMRDLTERYDFVLWVDADATFADTTADIADVATPERFLWMVEHAYRGGRQPCAAVLALHAGGEAAEFLDEVWGCEDLVEHPWWEQAAIMRLIGYDISLPDQVAFTGDTRWTSRVGMLGTEWCSMAFDPHPNPRIVHFTRAELLERAPLIAGYAERFALGRASSGALLEDPASFRPGISVILPVLPGRFERWAASLAALGDSGLADGDEVVIVDAASGLGGLFASLQGATVRRVPGGYGLTDAWEVGCESARNELVALLAGAVRPRPGWLDALCAALDAGASAARAYWSDEILGAEADGTLLQPGSCSLYGAERDLPAVGMKRADALGALRASDGLDGDGVSVVVSLARAGVQLRRAAGCYVDLPLPERGWTRSIALRPDAPLSAPWYRWNYGDPASRLPFPEELPYFLEARGLDGTGVIVNAGRGRLVSHILAHWGCRRLVVLDDGADSPEHRLDMAELAARVATFHERVEMVPDAGRYPFERFEPGSLDFIWLGSSSRGSDAGWLTEWVRRLSPAGVIGVATGGSVADCRLDQPSGTTTTATSRTATTGAGPAGILRQLGLDPYTVPGEGSSAWVIASHSPSVRARTGGPGMDDPAAGPGLDPVLGGSEGQPVVTTLDAERLCLEAVVESFLEAAQGCGQGSTDRLRAMLQEVPASTPEAAWLANRILEAEADELRAGIAALTEHHRVTVEQIEAEHSRQADEYEKALGAVHDQEAALREELAEVYASTSWRVSAPVRWVRNHVLDRVIAGHTRARSAYSRRPR